MNGKTERWASGRARFAIGLVASAAAAVPGAIAHAQAPQPVYSIPTPGASPAAGGGGQRVMTPFPKVRTAGRFTRTRTRFTRVTVTAPEGALVRARCKRTRCSLRRTITRPSPVRLRRLERTFRPRAVIEIRVTTPGEVGKHVEIRIRRGRAPLRRDRCLDADSAVPQPCGSA